MLQRYLQICLFISNLDSAEVNDRLPHPAEDIRKDQISTFVKGLECIPPDIQREDATLYNVRDMFAEVTAEYPSMKDKLASCTKLCTVILSKMHT